MPRKSNPLYHFMLSDAAHIGRAGLGTPEEKQTTGGIPYIFTRLAPPPFSSVVLGQEEWNLQHHHISVYSDIGPPKGDIYHYTADLMNPTGLGPYKAHVYFDAHGNVIGEPSLKDPDDTVIRPEGAKEALTELAIMHSTRLMVHIHQKQQTAIQKLTENISREMDQLFALPQNALPELEICAKQTLNILSKSEQLTLIGGPRNLHDLLMNFHSTIDWAIADATPKTSTVKPSDETVDHPLATSAAEATTPEPAASEPIATLTTATAAAAHLTEKAPQTPKKVSQLIELIAELKTHKIACQAQDVTPEMLIAYNDKARELLGIYADCQHCKDVVSGNYPSIIMEALRDSQQKCLDKLERGIVLNVRPILDSPLINYIPNLNPSKNFFEFSIKKGNAALLELLLRNAGILPINLITAHEDTQQMSLLEFAFRRQSPPCFEALLRAGASPMVLTADGLPLACLVLAQQKGPFYDLLMRHYQTQDNHRCLMSQLATTVRELSLSSQSTEQRATYSNILEQLQVYLIPTRQILGPKEGVLKQQAIISAVGAHAAAAMTPTMVGNLRANPIICGLLEQQQLLLHEISSKDKKVAARLLRHGTRWIVDSEETLRSLGENITVDTAILDLKHCLDRLRLVNELVDLEAERNQLKGHNSRKKRQCEESIRRIHRLLVAEGIKAEDTKTGDIEASIKILKATTRLAFFAEAREVKVEAKKLRKQVLREQRTAALPSDEVIRASNALKDKAKQCCDSFLAAMGDDAADDKDASVILETLSIYSNR